MDEERKYPNGPRWMCGINFHPYDETFQQVDGDFYLLVYETDGIIVYKVVNHWVGLYPELGRNYSKILAWAHLPNPEKVVKNLDRKRTAISAEQSAGAYGDMPTLREA